MMLDINITQAREGFVKYMPFGILFFFIMSALLSAFFYSQFENSDKNIILSIDLIGTDNTKNLGYLLYTEYVVAFEIAAVILLLGIISAITLTHTKNQDTKYQDPSDQVSVTKKDRLIIIKDSGKNK
jgi:NADH-quinone oxidoreductase subunit J